MIYFHYATVKNSLLLKNVKEYSTASSEQTSLNYDVVVVIIMFFWLDQIICFYLGEVTRNKVSFMTQVSFMTLLKENKEIKIHVSLFQILNHASVKLDITLFFHYFSFFPFF